MDHVLVCKSTSDQTETALSSWVKHLQAVSGQKATCSWTSPKSKLWTNWNDEQREEAASFPVPAAVTVVHCIEDLVGVEFSPGLFGMSAEFPHAESSPSKKSLYGFLPIFPGELWVVAVIFLEYFLLHQ